MQHIKKETIQNLLETDYSILQTALESQNYYSYEEALADLTTLINQLFEELT